MLAPHPGYPAPEVSAGCSTMATTRLAMNRAVLTAVPVLVTSLTSTTPRRLAISTRRPARVAVTSYVWVPSPESITISTRSPFIGHLPAINTPRTGAENPARSAQKYDVRRDRVSTKGARDRPG